MLRMTKVERRVAKAWGKMVPGFRVKLKDLRGIEGPFSMRQTAYHEAGHVAARLFTGQDASHVLRVSIMPDSKCKRSSRSACFRS